MATDARNRLSYIRIKYADYILSILRPFRRKVKDGEQPCQERVKPLREMDRGRRTLLTKREREVFELLVQDKTTKEIAAQLFISEKTVRNHISNTMQKLGVKGRSQAVIELIRMGELKI